MTYATSGIVTDDSAILVANITYTNHLMIVTSIRQKDQKQLIVQNKRKTAGEYATIISKPINKGPEKSIESPRY